jgi:hypothetical protein
MKILVKIVAKVHRPQTAGSISVKIHWRSVTFTVINSPYYRFVTRIASIIRVNY